MPSIFARHHNHNNFLGQPPPYSNSPSDGFRVVAETVETTTTTTVTTRTTRFFSNPLPWRRNHVHKQPPLMIEKQLPATPAPSNSSSSDLYSPERTVPIGRHSGLLDTPPSSSSASLARSSSMRSSSRTTPTHSLSTKPSMSRLSASPGPPNATTALARAALGLGMSPVQRPPEDVVHPHTIKRTKSFTKPKNRATASPRPRTSTGEREYDHVSRRLSFWGRKSEGLPPSTPPPVPTPTASSPVSLEAPTLPTMVPGSPFLPYEAPPTPRTPRTPAGPSSPLRRRHSTNSSNASSDRREPRNRLSLAELHPFPEVEHEQLAQYSETTPPPPPETLPNEQPRMPPKSRLRATTNPPHLLRRFSINLFSSSSSSPPPLPSLSIPNNQLISSASSSPLGSPRISTNRRSTIDGESPVIAKPSPPPKPEEGETPEAYLARLKESVGKSEIANVLASSNDAFHASALRAYITTFDFSHDALDVALRRLLMDVGLPRETQQIDRVMEVFASRYIQCQADRKLFEADDNAYILAFSLIMLHTDFFNKANKRKMTKSDYVRNTRVPGVPADVLECFYDNVVFAPFIFVEDAGEGVTQAVSALPGTSEIASASSSTLLGRSPKIDPYYLITKNLLDPLRADMDSLIPPRTPYTWEGTLGPWDVTHIHSSFAHPSMVVRMIAFGAADGRTSPLPIYSLSVGGAAAGPGPVYPVSADTIPGKPWILNIAKIGVLTRKDDIAEGGKRASNRKWRPWSVLLAGARLLFYRDGNVVQDLHQQAQVESDVVLTRPPDESMNVQGAVAVFDKLYIRRPNTLRLVVSGGRHLLLQAKDELDMNEWISHINYASAFKTANLRMRAPRLSADDVALAGAAAAGANVDVPAHLGQASQFQATFEEVKRKLDANRGSSFEERGNPRLHLRSRSYSIDACQTNAIRERQSTSGSRSRSEAIARVDAQILELHATLQADLRAASNYAVLTPFQRAARVRVQAAVDVLAVVVQSRRLEQEMLACHRHVLAADQVASQREWREVTTSALRAARLTLENRREEQDAVEMRRPPLTPSRGHRSRAASMSRTEEVEEEAIDVVEINRPPLTPARSHRSRAASLSRTTTQRESTFSESFYSAVDWSSSVEGDLDKMELQVSPNTSIQQMMLSPPLLTPNTDTGGNSSQSSFPSTSAADTPRRSDEAMPLGRGHERFVTAADILPLRRGQHERFVTAPEPEHEMLEEAEEWNKTRAAKRVSLVRIPRDVVQFSAFLDRRTG